MAAWSGRFCSFQPLSYIHLQYGRSVALRVSGFDWDEGNRRNVKSMDFRFRKSKRFCRHSSHCTRPEAFRSGGPPDCRRTNRVRSASFRGFYPQAKGQQLFDSPGDGSLHAREGDRSIRKRKFQTLRRTSRQRSFLPATFLASIFHSSRWRRSNSRRKAIRSICECRRSYLRR